MVIVMVAKDKGRYKMKRIFNQKIPPTQKTKDKVEFNKNILGFIFLANYLILNKYIVNF